MPIQAPLNFHDYFISELTVKANPAFDSKLRQQDQIPLSVKLEIKDKKNDPKQCLLQLEYTLGNQKNNLAGCPYYISIHISGFFQIVNDFDENKIFELKHLNAPAILYGIARGIIAQNVASAQHGKFILPSINFLALLKQKKQPAKKVKKPANC
jgi:preprotein translocase subunit SecB